METEIIKRLIREVRFKNEHEIPMSPMDRSDYAVMICALDKQIPKEPRGDKSDERTLWKCPDCGYIFVTQYADGSLCAGWKSEHCPKCGQKMNWEVTP